MSETFDSVPTSPGSGGANLAGDSFSQGSTTIFLPAAYLVYGTAGNTYTRVDTGSGLPVTLQNSTVAVTQSGSWTVAVSGTVAVTDNAGSLTVDAVDLDIRDLTSGSDSVAAVQSGTWTVQPGNTANTTAWKVTGTGGTFPVTDNAGSLTVDAPVGTPVFVRLSDGTSAISTLAVSAAQSGDWTVKLGTAYDIDDAISNPVEGAAIVSAVRVQWNGSTFERMRGPQDKTAFSSNTYSATHSTGALTNYNARGLYVFVKVTAAGTGNLTVSVGGVDVASGGTFPLGTSPAITTTGAYAIVFYPDSAVPGAGSTTLSYAFSLPLPRTFYIQVIHSDSSNWTYSVGYSLMP